MDKLEYSALGQSIYHCALPNGLSIYVDVRPEYAKQFAFLPPGTAGWICGFGERMGSGCLPRRG